MAHKKTTPNSFRENSLLTLLEEFRPGLTRLALRHHLEVDEVISEGAISFTEAETGFDPRRGNFSRRWWFLLSKRILKLAPRRTDAMAHVDNTLLDVGMTSENDQSSDGRW